MNISLGFSGIEQKSSDSKNRTYALFIGDTVQVAPDAAVPLTNVDKSLSVISYTLGDEENASADENEDLLRMNSNHGGGAVMEKKLRGDKSAQVDKVSNELKRRAHQKILAELRQADGLARFDDAPEKDKVAKAVFRKFESYRKDAPLPKSVSDLRVLVVFM